MQSISFTPQSITLDPVSRIEGHLKVDVVIDMVNARQVVVDAKTTGTMFRGIETILTNRSPLDAPDITQGSAEYVRFLTHLPLHPRWKMPSGCRLPQCTSHAQPRSGR